VGKLARRAAQSLDLVDVDRFEQRLTGRKVTVERADSDPGPPGDLLERSVRAGLGEDAARSLDQLLVVAAGVGPFGRLEVGEGVGRADGVTPLA